MYQHQRCINFSSRFFFNRNINYLVLFFIIITLEFTVLKKFKLLILLIDLLTKISLKDHLHQALIDYELHFQSNCISKNINSFYIKFFTFFNIKFKLIILINIFNTLAFINLYCSRVVIDQFHLRILSIVLIEYGLPLIFLNNFLYEKLFSSKSVGSLSSNSPK